MNNKFKCVNLYIYMCVKWLNCLWFSYGKPQASFHLPLSGYRDFHPTTHSFHITHTKIVTFIYWIYVIKGGDRLTTIWFNTVNICILLDDFKWHKQSLQYEAVASFGEQNIFIKVTIHRMSGCTWRIPSCYTEYEIRICVLCTVHPWMVQIVKLLSLVQVNDESQYDLYFDWICLNQASIFQIISKSSACYLSSKYSKYSLLTSIIGISEFGSPHLLVENPLIPSNKMLIKYGYRIS